METNFVSGRRYLLLYTVISLISAAQAQTRATSLPDAIVDQEYPLPLSMQLSGTFPWKFSVTGPVWLHIDPSTVGVER